MASQHLTQPHQSLPGTWKLASGRAVTLQPREAGLLRIAHGTVWVTRDGPHSGPLNDQGDHFLHSGEQLPLLRGQRLVIEAWDRQQPAYFSWDPWPQGERHRLGRAAVIQPLDDLRLALVLGAGAAERLLTALAGLPWNWVRGARLSRADCAFNAQSSACRPHGVMS